MKKYIIERKRKDLSSKYNDLISKIGAAIGQVNFQVIPSSSLITYLRAQELMVKSKKRPLRFKSGDSFILGIDYLDLPYQGLKVYPEYPGFVEAAAMLNDFDSLRKLERMDLIVKINYTRLEKRTTQFDPWRYILYDYAIGTRLDKLSEGDLLLEEWRYRLEKSTVFTSWAGKKELIYTLDGRTLLTDLMKISRK